MLRQPYPVFVRTVGADPNVPGVVAGGTDTVVSKATTPSRDRILTWQVTADADPGQALEGQFSVEVSNSTDLEFARGEEKWTANPQTPDTGAIPATALASGAAVTTVIKISNAGFYRYRLKFVATSGAGYVYANCVVG